MSSYFSAAERCGLRANVEEFKRVARRTVASSSPARIREQTAQAAAAEALAVAATGARKPAADIVPVPAEQLPFADDRALHQRDLMESEADISLREARDLTDVEQQRKVLALEAQALRDALAAEAAEAAECARRALEREAATREAQAQTRQRLRAAYGPCFLWNSSSADSADNLGSRQPGALDRAVARQLEAMPWVEERLSILGSAQ